MFLEIVTLAVLAIVLVTKWATSRSAQNLVLQRTELDNEYHKLRGDYNKLFEQRKSSEEQAKTLGAEIAELQETLEEIKVDLEDQIDRNEELGG